MKRFRLPARPARRRPSLTPMVDVVFLLLVFFMVAARFGAEAALPLASASAGASTWEGAPRVVRIAPDRLLLNGAPIEASALAEALRALSPTPDAPVVLAGFEGATLQDIARVVDQLTAAGAWRLILAE